MAQLAAGLVLVMGGKDAILVVITMRREAARHGVR